MSTITQINESLEEANSLKIIAQAYSEIAAMKLRKIRTGIERNRTFFQEVLQVYRAVKVISEKRGIIPPEKRKGSVCIILTSNKKFYGDLEQRLVQYFSTNSTKFPTDRIVVGKTAQELLKSYSFSHPYQNITFREDIPQPEEIGNLVNQLNNYQQILVYYSRMRSVLVQEPHVVDLLQRPPESFLEDPKHHFDYFFEPELEQILQFFNSQITTLLLEQTVLESELARTASRLISMDQAQGNAEDMLKGQKRLLSAAKKSMEHMRLLDTIAALVVQKKGFGNYVN